jgi:5'-3' exonuclease
MGIKYFFGWLKKTFPNYIETLKISNITNIKDEYKIDIDNFLVDMNGIFHYCCQKVYGYGSFKHLNKNSKKYNKKNELFEMIGNYIDKLITIVKPNKRVVLAIDGVAPISKICQQKSRRFKSSIENIDSIEVFDSNSITPGTKFMDNLSRYIDWFIRKNMSIKKWGDIEIIFSSEKSPGEGEHKLVSFVRNKGDINESYMIQGMDSDLIMLSLATHYPHFHILRENPYKYENEYFYINISAIREYISNALLCDQSLISDKIHINDFITMIFLTGNDFLPHLPTIEILEGGVDMLFETYRNVSKQYESLTNNIEKIDLKFLRSFLGTLSTHELSFLEEKRIKPINYPDILLDKHTKINKEGKYVLDFNAYKKEYYFTKMNISSEKEIKEACLKYIQGLQWILTYYTKGVTNWKWFYPYHYAPFISDIATYMEDLDVSYLVEKCEKSNKNSYPPFLQLLCVLPKKSSNLLPYPLNDIVHSKKLEEYYPDNFIIDMDGKHNSWEGIVLIPHTDFCLIEKEYKVAINKVDEKERRRNIIGKSFIYTNTNFEYTFKSFHGDLKNCITETYIYDIL